MTRCWLALALLAASTAFAHEPSRSLLQLTLAGDRIDGRLDLSLRDLEDAIGLDANGDLAITWGELDARRVEVARYVLDHLGIRADGASCGLDARADSVDAHGGATYAVVDLSATCASAPGRIDVDYSLLFAVDPAHRALLQVDGVSAAAVLSMERPSFGFEPAAASAWSSAARFIVEGVWHIWHGYDHLAFLALLVVPALLGSRRAQAASASAALWSIARIVTAFTLAHSLTLGLAVLGIVRIPAAAVEIVIAVSVLVAALLCLSPRAVALGSKLAFSFGLVHGLGFANALGDLGAERANLVASLGGFNLGVELGQLALVGAALPLLLAIRRLPSCSTLVVRAGSVGCAALALCWIIERV